MYTYILCYLCWKPWVCSHAPNSIQHHGVHANFSPFHDYNSCLQQQKVGSYYFSFTYYLFNLPRREWSYLVFKAPRQAVLPRRHLPLPAWSLTTHPATLSCRHFFNPLGLGHHMPDVPHQAAWALTSCIGLYLQQVTLLVHLWLSYPVLVAFHCGYLLHNTWAPTPHAELHVVSKSQTGRAWFSDWIILTPSFQRK